MNSYPNTHPRCMVDSHSAANTVDAVTCTSEKGIDKLTNFLSEIHQ